MSMSVIVHGREKAIEVTVRSNGTVSETTLKGAFLLPQNLLVSLSENGRALERQQEGNEIYYNLGDNFKGKEFKLEWCENRVMTPVPMEVERIEKTRLILNQWKDRVFVVFGEKKEVQGSGVLISEHRLLTAGHLKFKLNNKYVVKGTNNRSFKARCEFISISIDIAVLVSEEFPECPTPIGLLQKGDKYVVIGYPIGVDISSPSVSKGTIEGIMTDGVHLVGVPGSKRGYSGSPVFDSSGSLAGVLLGSTTFLSAHSTLHECLVTSAEQTSSRILTIAVGQTMRVEHACPIRPSSSPTPSSSINRSTSFFPSFILYHMINIIATNQ